MGMETLKFETVGKWVVAGMVGDELVELGIT